MQQFPPCSLSEGFLYTRGAISGHKTNSLIVTIIEIVTFLEQRCMEISMKCELS